METPWNSLVEWNVQTVTNPPLYRKTSTNFWGSKIQGHGSSNGSPPPLRHMSPKQGSPSSRRKFSIKLRSCRMQCMEDVCCQGSGYHKNREKNAMSAKMPSWISSLLPLALSFDSNYIFNFIGKDTSNIIKHVNRVKTSGKIMTSLYHLVELL